MKFTLFKSKNVRELKSDKLDQNVILTNEISLSYSSEICSFQQLSDLYFLWYGEYGCEPNYMEIANSIHTKTEPCWDGRGILIVINISNNNISVYGDLYGTFPVYYSNSSPEDVLVSDSLLAFNASIDNLDYISLLQYIKYAYTIGPYSIIKNVNRLEANTILMICKYDISLKRLKNFWITNTNVNFSHAVDMVASMLIEEVKNFPRSQLMFSAGWDSRTLFASLLYGKRDFSCYTHGNTDSREIKIATKICSDNNIRQLIKPLSMMSFDPSVLNNMVNKHGSAMSPHWITGSKTAIEDSRIITGGTFGAVLGGHNGPVNSCSGIKKHLSLAANILDFEYPKHLTSHENVDYVFDYYKEKTSFTSWILSDAANSNISDTAIIVESNRRLLDVLDRYYAEGSTTVESLFERYKSEHSGARYMNLQLINSDSKHRNPFTNSELIRYVSTIPYKFRIHNKINKEIIKKINPKLLDYPMAATLINASRPILLQEASRAARKLVEKSNTLLSVTSKFSKYPYKVLGWNNFEFLRNADYLKQLSDSYKTEIFHLANINNKPLENISFDMYSYLDMICKSITVDRIISKDEGEMVPKNRTTSVAAHAQVSGELPIMR
jgi:hypothetical protein